jgi:hypothetical protein
MNSFLDSREAYQIAEASLGSESRLEAVKACEPCDPLHDACLSCDALAVGPFAIPRAEPIVAASFTGPEVASIDPSVPVVRVCYLAIQCRYLHALDTASYFPLSASLQDLGTLNVFHALPPEGL